MKKLITLALLLSAAMAVESKAELPKDIRNCPDWCAQKKKDCYSQCSKDFKDFDAQEACINGLEGCTNGYRANDCVTKCQAGKDEPY